MAAKQTGSLSLRRGAGRAGFTLIEMLVSITILVILMVVLFSVSTRVAGLWKSTSGKISAFQNARSAFSTLSATLARATLNTYSDYANVTGGTYYFRHPDDPADPTNLGNVSNFVPTTFARTSELHFLCGPTTDIANATETTASGTALHIDSTPAINPGHAVFFQAPLGNTTTGNLGNLRRTMNSVGFYVEYGLSDANLVPDWLLGVAGTKNYRFRLVEFIEATERLQIYPSTMDSSYLLDWLNFAGPPAGQLPRKRVLAEDVLLLIVLPRLSPADESTAARNMGGTYDQATQFGSILCPNYHFDSRAWQKNYPGSLRVNAAAYGTQRARLMMNQMPPIVDVVMVCADALSLARFDSSAATPPAVVAVPSGLFQNSAKLEADLATYADQLAKKNIRFHIQRAAVGIQSAKWSNG